MRTATLAMSRTGLNASLRIANREHTRTMNFQFQRHLATFDCIALLLQGGGALGAYQGGVYEALAEADIHPDWIAGISIGAINAAIIAGNPPASRVDRLREFWTQVTSDVAAGDYFGEGRVHSDFPTAANTRFSCWTSPTPAATISSIPTSS